MDQKKPGKPPKAIDEAILKQLTKRHLSDKVICAILGISEDTLHRRYQDQMDTWAAESDVEIADAVYDEGVNNREPWALKALAQKRLGFSDKSSVEVTDLSQKSDEELEAYLVDLRSKQSVSDEP